MNRIESVDIFRLIAVIAVIAIHTTPFRGDVFSSNETYKYIDVTINQLARFAVPFFFVISGYFWGVKIRNGADTYPTSLRMAKRISIIFLAWSAIYLLPINLGTIYEHGFLGPIKAIYWNLTPVIEQPMLLLLQGTKGHLWFLVGLLFSLFITAFFVRTNKIKSLVLLSVALYIFGVLANAYADTPIGLTIGFNTRLGPFFGTLLFVTGYIISGVKIKPSWFLYGAITFSIGALIHFSEIYILLEFFNTKPQHDYVVGTYFMGVGFAMAALSNHPILKSKTLSKFAQLSLGIYAIHFVFVDIFEPIDRHTDSVSWQIAYIAVVFVLSVTSAWLLSKNKVTKKIVV